MFWRYASQVVIVKTGRQTGKLIDRPTDLQTDRQEVCIAILLRAIQRTHTVGGSMRERENTCGSQERAASPGNVAIV